MSMESGLDPQLEKRNEGIRNASEDSGLPIEDLKRLQLSVDGDKSTISGSINGVQMTLTYRLAPGNARTFGEQVSLNGHELKQGDAISIYSKIAPAVWQVNRENKSHIAHVQDEAYAENEAFDRQKDPYNAEVKPLIDKLLGKSIG